MKQRKRIYYSPEQKALIWTDIIRAIRCMISPECLTAIYQTGGYRPPDRKRPPQSLSLDEREEISRCLVSNQSIRETARRLSRAPSTIRREIKRDGGLKCYRAVNVEQRVWEEALRPKPCKLIGSPELCKLIAVKLKRAWSPQQITGWLKRQYPNNQEMYVSHKTIYKYCSFRREVH